MAAVTFPFYNLTTVANVTSFTQDAATDVMVYSFIAQSTTAIKKFQWYTTKTGTPHDLLVFLAADNNSVPAGTPGSQPTDIGGGSPTLVSIANASITTGVNTATFTNAYTPTVGTRYHVVLFPGSTGGSAWGASHKYAHVILTGLFELWTERGLTSTDTTTTWAYNDHGIMSFSLQDASDNYLPLFHSAVLSSTTLRVTSITSASSPNEYGTAFVVPANQALKLHGVYAGYRIADATNSDFRVQAWTDPLGTPSSLELLDIDVSAFYPVISSDRRLSYWLPSGPYTVSAGATVGVSWRATGTGGVGYWQAIFHSQAAKEAALLLKSLFGIDRSGGSGAFTARYDRIYSVYPWMSIEDQLGRAVGLQSGGRL